ncbi:hypothetical protein KFK09_024513 [Dendrobium nobile]|uniref:Uncharacterized protein n=1 Tax=Dendrobium nobile TaxID=94219 RepID=A0A8T3AE17_DENNO|nr:hypothetical protein KFK09_024513 [Dendrobium nobile]
MQENLAISIVAKPLFVLSSLRLFVRKFLVGRMRKNSNICLLAHLNILGGCIGCTDGFSCLFAVVGGSWTFYCCEFGLLDVFIVWARLPLGCMPTALIYH